MQLVRGMVPYASLLLAAAICFGLGLYSGPDRWTPFAQFMDTIAGPGRWEAQAHEYDPGTGRLVVLGLRLADGAFLGLRCPVSVDSLEIKGAVARPDLARADLLVARGLTCGLSGPGLEGTLAFGRIELEHLNLAGKGPGLAISADRAQAFDVSASLASDRGQGQPVGLELALASLGLGGGLNFDQAGRLRAGLGELSGLAISLGPEGDRSSLSLASLGAKSIDGKGRAETVDLQGLEFLWPRGGAAKYLRLGRLSALAADLGPLAQRLSGLSPGELAELALASLGQPSRPGLTADLALSRPFGADRASLQDLVLGLGEGGALAAGDVSIETLSRFVLRARIGGLGLDLDPPGSEGERPAWMDFLAKIGLAHLEGGLELASTYRPTEQAFLLEVEGLRLQGLLSGRLRLELAGLDRASLASLAHLGPGNALGPLLEPGLHHSRLVRLDLELEDESLAETLIRAFEPGETDLDAAGRRLSDLLEMALTMRLDDAIENTGELSGLARTFLVDPGRITATVAPETPLTPGEVRLSRNLPVLLNAMNLAFSVNQEPPVRVVFRTAPMAFDRDYTADDYGLYPGESRP
jgi:hypothetical protein